MNPARHCSFLASRLSHFARAIALGGAVSLLPGAATAKTCKQVESCAEAVELWCGGYARADADRDGIPCENICYSRDQVDEIRAQIGCAQP